MFLWIGVLMVIHILTLILYLGADLLKLLLLLFSQDFSLIHHLGWRVSLYQHFFKIVRVSFNDRVLCWSF